ncbi:MAG: VCBS repeat-containing protein, partial [Actinobacteria bacterium]|nr:VCBS repeat-containing protein [Actinomycetota bacterium]
MEVMLGTGGGNFSPPTHLHTGEGPRSVAVGDFNGDGLPDLAAANSGNGASADVALLLGTGHGNFGPPTTFASSTIGRPHMLVVADFNGDGHADVAVANFWAQAPGSDVSVFLGDGAGHLGVSTRYHTGLGTSSIAVADFNRDGKPDLVVTNLLGGDMAVLFGTGGGTFGPAVTFKASGNNPNIVAVGDFNRDGFADLAVAMLEGGVSVTLNDGTGGFGPGTNYPVGGVRPWAVTVGDFNGDGRPDLAVT